jgi:outer membrane receptor protein involved in Fe transport
VTSFRIRLLVGAALAALSAGSAVAQTAPAPAPTTPAPAAKPAPKEETAVDTVEITAAPAEVRTSVDSTSYSLANDLQARTGSLADALRNIPSVDVDPQGNVSLRGDANVTILVDGRPSGVLSGDGRAQAILSLPADQYARVEVMTNPSAAYSPEGSGGVINLITKPTAVKPGNTATGSVRANVGNGERWNLGVSANTTLGDLTLSGDLGYRRDVSRQSSDRLRERLDPLTGAVLSTTRQSQGFEGPSNVAFSRLSLEYKLSKMVTLGGELRGNDIDNVGSGAETLETVNAAGLPTAGYNRDLDFGFQGDNVGATARVITRFAEGHDWTNEVRLDRNRGHVSFASVFDFDLPPAADLYEASDNRFNVVVLGLTSAYVRPMSGDAKLRAGYELESRDVILRQSTRRGPSPTTLVPDPFVTNRFEMDQQVHAFYGTYERPFGKKISAQVGLRLEYADLELRQVTTAITETQDYLRLYPTLHVNYQITDSQSVKASYSRRIQRPQPFLLNPFTSYQDPLNLRAGNPDLEPQETDSYEVMWQMRAGQTFYQVTGYFRDTDGAFTEVATDIGGGVLLTRPENLGSRRDLGLELVANGPITKTLKYSTSFNVFRQQIDAAGLPGGEDREGTVFTARGSLSWQPTPEDFLQVSGQWQGDSLTAQGERQGGGLLNLGYRRKLTEKLAFQLTVRDILDNFGDTLVTETSNFTDRTDREFGGRAWFVGLTYSFGATPKRERDPQFDFSAPTTGG